MSTAIALPRTATDLVIERGNPEFEATCAFMAREFQEATTEIRRLAAALESETARLFTAFKSECERGYNPFEVSLSYQHRSRHEKIDVIIGEMKRKAWAMLFDRIGVKKVMSVAKRADFDKRLESGDLPEITEEAVVDVILGMVEQAEDFAKEAALEVFEILRPNSGEYKTNSAFRVGRRVVLTWFVEPGWDKGKFRVGHTREQQLIAIDGVFHLLDGKGVLGERKGPLVKAIQECGEGRGETEFFRFRCFKNRNLHLEFKRLDLVKQLNLLGAGEHVLGKDGD